MNLYLLHFVLPSLSPVYVIDYAKCPSPGTEYSERNSLFSVLHGRKIAFSRPWFPSIGTENNINACYFTQKHTFETRGAKDPCLTYRIRERMFQGAKVPWSESSRERKFQGAKVPPMVHVGTKVPVTRQCAVSEWFLIVNECFAGPGKMMPSLSHWQPRRRQSVVVTACLTCQTPTQGSCYKKWFDHKLNFCRMLPSCHWLCVVSWWNVFSLWLVLWETPLIDNQWLRWMFVDEDCVDSRFDVNDLRTHHCLQGEPLVSGIAGLSALSSSKADTLNIWCKNCMMWQLSTQ